MTRSSSFSIGISKKVPVCCNNYQGQFSCPLTAFRVIFYGIRQFLVLGRLTFKIRANMYCWQQIGSGLICESTLIKSIKALHKCKNFFLFCFLFFYSICIKTKLLVYNILHFSLSILYTEGERLSYGKMLYIDKVFAINLCHIKCLSCFTIIQLITTRNKHVNHWEKVSIILYD